MGLSIYVWHVLNHRVPASGGSTIGTGGLAVIGHQDGTADALRVTKCASRTCK